MDGQGAENLNYARDQHSVLSKEGQKRSAPLLSLFSLSPVPMAPVQYPSSSPTLQALEADRGDGHLSAQNPTDFSSLRPEPHRRILPPPLPTRRLCQRRLVPPLGQRALPHRRARRVRPRLLGGRNLESRGRITKYKEMERLSMLLQEDSELQKLHKQFVLRGDLTEAVFWATEDHPDDCDGMIENYLCKSNRVTFNLTLEIIHQIFAGKSAVHRAYLKFVPNKLTEKDFWTKYCRAEYLHCMKNAFAAAAEATEDEDLVAFLKRDDAWASEAKHKDHGMSRNGSDSATDSQYEEYGRSLSQVLNRHGAVVLEGRSIDGLKTVCDMDIILLIAKIFHLCLVKMKLTVLAMVAERFGLQQLDLLPSGVSLPLRHQLYCSSVTQLSLGLVHAYRRFCQSFRDNLFIVPENDFPTDWPAALYILLGQEDLDLSHFSNSSKSKESEPQNNVNLVSMSTPYMLNLHPVTIPSSISDTIGSEDTKFEDGDSVDGSVADGMEHIFNSTLQLRYGRDLRLNELSSLSLIATSIHCRLDVFVLRKTCAIQTFVNPTASDQDLRQVLCSLHFFEH
ncbi:hypothetical protein RHMOL_Rhmol04G0159900 [Rhododendron molle]|uniref:Uncharacterized protein n=1 Tax=Rhododendron molle TaxID=49168 RepID=A0ACC0P3H8_RHOML|nr:hypothetical protein RHMOL_Rhmol04G0159900 [Rhododendron molle]